MKILAIDTSALTASAAVLDGDTLKGEITYTTALTHSQTIMPMIDEILSSLDLKPSDIDIFACGIGSPYFSTDTAAVLRAKEIDAEIVLLAKNIDAVYTADPRTNPDAKRLENIRYMDVLAQNLAVMDTTATSFSMENKLPVLVFGLNDPENIVRAVMGEKLGTIVEA